MTIVGRGIGIGDEGSLVLYGLSFEQILILPDLALFACALQPFTGHSHESPRTSSTVSAVNFSIAYGILTRLTRPII